MLKRAHDGTYHKLSPKHLNRYVQEFAGKHNVRELGTPARMRDTVARLVGRNPLCPDLIADNGLSSGAGRRGRSSARASFSGVAPLRSRWGSSIGFMPTGYSWRALRGSPCRFGRWLRSL